MFKSDDKTMFMPGPLSPGHHQIGQACDSCHTDALGGGEVIQQACVDCHGEDRKKPHDSHPASKFTDPRNADRLEKIEATNCITCHTEHRPEITLKDGLTQPRDICFHCHAEVAKERPSHEGMSFESCKDSGCHNFHNNRALYTDFLVKHLHEPHMLETQRLPERSLAEALAEITEYPHDRYPLEPVDADATDAPEDSGGRQDIKSDWSVTAHAQAGVNCSACHVVAQGGAADPAWQDDPGDAGCARCHGLEIERFKKGKHGMRLAVGLSPMTPAMARLPMKQESAHKALTCNSCHKAHGYDTNTAAVDACLDCHSDEHSLAYSASPHFALWQKELSGALPEGSGVSCASCHMPRVDFDVNDWVSRVMVEHNQSANLSPNSKMIRGSCLHCHGLEFTLDSLADRALIDRNFAGRSVVHVKSMELAERDHQRALQETAGVQE